MLGYLVTHRDRLVAKTELLEEVWGSRFVENWISMFCLALTRIGEGEGHASYLGQARQRAEAKGCRADVDCVFALAYEAACRDQPVQAAELVGASGGGLFHDTANFVHHLLIRDRVVRPLLDPAAFEEAVARGRQRPVAEILAQHDL